MSSEAMDQAIKNPAGAGFFASCNAPGSGSLQRLDAGGQAALVAGSLVLVDQATRAETIEDRLGDDESSLGTGGIVRFERLQHLLDGGAQHRTLTGVAGIAHDGLLGALLGGLDIGHGGNPGNLVVKPVRMKKGFGAIRQESMGESVACVNNGRVARRWDQP